MRAKVTFYGSGGGGGSGLFIGYSGTIARTGLVAEAAAQVAIMFILELRCKRDDCGNGAIGH